MAWSFTTASRATSCPCSIWAPSATPQVMEENLTTNTVEVGVKFRSDVAGLHHRRPLPQGIAGQPPGTSESISGPSSGQLTWRRQPSPARTASGWQQVSFRDAGGDRGQHHLRRLVLNAPIGRYLAQQQLLHRRRDRHHKRAADEPCRTARPAATASTATGAAAAFFFPNQDIHQSENYWVNVVFARGRPPTRPPPTVVDRVPAAGRDRRAGRRRGRRRPSASRSPARIDLDGAARRRRTRWSRPPRRVRRRHPHRHPDPDRRAWRTPRSYTVERQRRPRTRRTTPWRRCRGRSQTAAPPPPGLEDGPGRADRGRHQHAATRRRRYLAEILRAEGLNEFANVRVVDAQRQPRSRRTHVVVLGDVAITDAQVAALTDWVNAGGNLIAMRPDSAAARARRAHRAGRAPSPTATSAVNAAAEPGAGITTDTMQFHGTANRYTPQRRHRGRRRSTPAPPPAPACPAVTLRSVGTNGGQVATFAFDLARSVDRHPAGQPRPGPARTATARRRTGPNDLFFGGSTAPTGSTWPRSHIPQADEQQRLLANLVDGHGPRPAAGAAVLVLPRARTRPSWSPPATTTAPAAPPAGSAPTPRPARRAARWPRWECPRFTSYVYPSTPMTNAQAAAFNAPGLRGRPAPARTAAPTSRRTSPSQDDVHRPSSAAWRAAYSTRCPSPTTSRYHCIVWSDWVSQAKAELANGIRLDTNYYYYPGSWIAGPARLHERLGHADAVHRHRRLDDRRLPGQHQHDRRVGPDLPVHPEHAARPGARPARATTAPSPPTCTPTAPRPSRTPRCWPRPRPAACRSSPPASC